MFSALVCLRSEHDWRLVALAFVVCLLASSAAVSIFHRALAARGRAQAIWIIVAGATTGCDVWATHFIAILAYRPTISIAYRIGLTTLSLVVAAIMMSAALGVAVRRSTLFAAPLGGVGVGIGVACMHYLGMSALELPGRVTWGLDPVIASILGGMALGAVALTVATRSDGLRGTLLAATLLMLTILSLHFSAMEAATIIPDPTRAINAVSIDQTGLAVGIAGCAAAVLGASIVGAQSGRLLAARAVEATARFHDLAEAASEAIAVCEDGTIVDVNSSFEKLVGMPASELYEKPFYQLLCGLSTAIPPSGGPTEILVRGANNQTIECEATSRSIAFRGRTSTVVSLRDLRERRGAEIRMRHLALHDPLTDLPNRTCFNEHFASTFDHAAATGEGFAIVSVDIDRFKEINDAFGHLVGDMVLCEVSRRLKSAAHGAFVARLGGDEFTFVISSGPQPSTAEALARRSRAALADEIVSQDNRLIISLSIGIAIQNAESPDAISLLANADAALHLAKAGGGGSIRLFDPEIAKQLRERRTLQHDLQLAVAHSELTLYYQPQALIGGGIVGFEALVRWRHPVRGLVAPGDFIPLAEESAAIISIGEWILREACREAASWSKPLQVAVNLSPIQFRHGDLPNLVHSILLETGLSPRRLELEITEGVLIGDFPGALSILRRLKSLGVRIAMDDFGTGYSSLSYLQSFPFDKIKIDRAFISNLEHKPKSAAIIRAVIGLGRGLDLPVVAEGVETEAQLAFLVSEECSEVQGYLVGRPFPIESYAELVGRPVGGFFAGQELVATPF
jgi:diguanylate cyclase (GGDEF)-like protein